MTSGFAQQAAGAAAGVDQGTGVEEEAAQMMLGPEETLSSIESNNRIEIPSISDVAVALTHDILFPPLAG